MNTKKVADIATYARIALFWALVGLGFPSDLAADSSPAPPAPAFAVASIRPNPKPTFMRLQYTDDGFLGEGVTLHQLILMAYDIPEYDRLAGEPEWVDTDYFDVKAKIDDSLAGSFDDLSMDQRNHMLQQLLADRFGLVVHAAKVVRPIYELLVAANGPKLTVARPDELHSSPLKGGGDGLFTRGDRGHLQVEGLSMDGFAKYLGTQVVMRPVMNRTGLTGRYTFSLHWVPEDLAPHASPIQTDTQNGQILDDPVGSSTIFAEIQKQLGLKLQPTKGPVEVLIVDRAAMPTPN